MQSLQATNTRAMSISDNKLSQRKQRERDCQLVALGVVLERTKMAAELETTDFLDDGVGSVIEALTGLLADSKSEIHRNTVDRWLRQHCGTLVSENERFADATVRTARSNARRTRVCSIAQEAVTVGRDGPVSDEQYIENVKRRISEA